ncbi:neuroligin- X-linked isoform X2, partial [Brachionus plicatilis]
MTFGKFLLFFYCAIEFIFGEPNLEDTLYETTSGKYRAKLVKLEGYGFSEPHYLHKLLSVPYAEKPERFKNSVFRSYELGTHEPRENLACYQSVNLSSYGFFSINEAGMMTEDCLVTNFYIPLAKNAEEKQSYRNMPVVIHIHGGSNMVGAAGLFDGSYLASKGKVIVAIINYRLSLFGFLSDFTEKYPGNYGLRDQILAIKWIKMNCAVLGCNPNSITLWGHSAGAGDANWLALSPLTNNLFQRIIIQSGSSFSYWAYDKMHLERYKSLKDYFNCTGLPDQVTPDNQAMTQLIDTCLVNVPIEDLFEFKFALIDAPGPTYDGFLGPESLINKHSLTEIMNSADHIENIDVLTGINGVEGFSFEGYFSSSVKFFTQNNLTNEVMLTLERFALLSREKCRQYSLIENRLKLEEFYTNKIRKYLVDEKYVDSEAAKRLKAIFANSDAIFDSGFIEFLNQIFKKKRENGKFRSNIFVYEYLHENTGNLVNIDGYKKILKNISLSTHFDGIDLVFGLPIAYINQNIKKDKLYDYPYRDFIFDTPFTKQEVDLSLLLIKYYTNFIRNGDPNIGQPINVKWDSYMNNRSYLRITTDLLKNKAKNSVQTFGVRDDLYKFWFIEMDKNGNCSSFDFDMNLPYESKRHTKGIEPALDKCFDLLNQSKEYNHLREMFLTEYENCMDSIGYIDHKLKNLFNTVCLDVIAVRRMIIEYETCCMGN